MEDKVGESAPPFSCYPQKNRWGGCSNTPPAGRRLSRNDFKTPNCQFTMLYCRNCSHFSWNYADIVYIWTGKAVGVDISCLPAGYLTLRIVIQTPNEIRYLPVYLVWKRTTTFINLRFQVRSLNVTWKPDLIWPEIKKILNVLNLYANSFAKFGGATRRCFCFVFCYPRKTDGATIINDML